MIAKIRNYIFTGFLILLPIVVSIAIPIWLLNAVTNNVISFLPSYLKGNLLWQIIIKLIILIALLVLLAIIGVITKIVFIKKILLLGEKLLLIKIPLFNKIYSTIKQISQAFLGTDKTIFSSVVIVEYPRNGIYSLGFITSKANGEIIRATKHEKVSVFIPTSPNPTGGMLIFVNPSEIKKLDMSIEDGMKFIISGGIITPSKN